ncbi:hypothetical protein O181_000602 [Austropuccinia psidii MF-1]|uniref:RNA helicase n=1 Tax=Austropuccinia psidii MF-1 TaxID=1389203 RepID=A0A9Q3GC81_9BASI|nr:hypothetical protein [Austropuccinia psidii MF-1]
MAPKTSKKNLKKSVIRGFSTTSVPKKSQASIPISNSPSDVDHSPSHQTSSDDQVSSLLSTSSNIKLDLQTNQSIPISSNLRPIAQEDWELDPEDRYIHSLAQKLRGPCDKEISTQLHIVKYDKRYAKGFMDFYWSDSSLLNKILQYAQSIQQKNLFYSKQTQPDKPSTTGPNEQEEKSLQRALVLHGFLQKCGFSLCRIDECLANIKAFEPEDALDYLLLNCSNEELILAGYLGLSPQNPDKHSPKQSELIKLPSNHLLENESSNVNDTIHSTRLNNTAVTKSLSSAMPLNLNYDAVDLSSDLKNKILLSSQIQTQEQIHFDAIATSPLIDEYVTLKLSIMRLSRKTKQLKSSLMGKALKDHVKIKKEIKHIENKLNLLQASYTFDQKRADQALNLKLLEIKQSFGAQDFFSPESLNSNLTSEGLGLKSDPSPVFSPITAMQSWDADPVNEDDITENKSEFEVIPTPTQSNPTQASTSNFSQLSSPVLISPPCLINSPSLHDLDLTEKTDDVHDLDLTEKTDDDNSIFGSIFQEPTLIPEAQKSVISQDQPLVVLRDMPLPKQFIGRTPQNLLEETLKRLDKLAQAQYLIISKGTAALRASVEITWSNPKMIFEYIGKPANSLPFNPSSSNSHYTQVFTMHDEACRDETQAYNYVATLALFHLNTQNVSTGHRNLPGTFRDLWFELEEKRKKEDDKNSLELLKKLLVILRQRACLNREEALALTKSKQSIPSPIDFIKTVEPISHLSSGQVDFGLRNEFALRQQWQSYQNMLAYRASLPIAAYRSEIINAVQLNQVILLCGETGCGKSTQLPAFILEHELFNGRPVKVFCTEPRRISAISLAQRVSQELGEPMNALGQVGSLVGYNIRFENKVSVTTRLIYATTGVVLRMLENGSDLENITHLIIDEVHERSIDSDFLLIALKTILDRRPNLRVILMSATVDAEKISNYMNGCPILKVPGRTFPVTSFFLEDVIELTNYQLRKKTYSPYILRMNKKKRVVLKTIDSQEEIPDLDEEDEDGTKATLAHTYAESTRTTLELLDEYQINMDLIVLLLLQICHENVDLVNRFSTAILIFLPSLDSIRKLMEILESHAFFGTSAFQIYPLHSSISNENQSAVFLSPPPGVRKIVISTNIAETGITIPDVTCVIDSGKHREMRYDEKRQISKLVETFIAKSNATQRKGRAGRVQEGICFHLFTKHRMETQLADNPLPEMLRLSLQDLALRIKIMKIGTSIEDVLSKALDPPPALNVQGAIASLVEVKALTSTEEITPLGRHLVKLPLDIHMGKLLILGCFFRCLSPALTVAAALNCKSPFLTPFGREQEADAIKRSFKVENSDFLTICNVYKSWRQAIKNDSTYRFCQSNMLSHPNLLQIEELRREFLGYLVDAGFVELDENPRDNFIHRQDTRNPLTYKLKHCKIPNALDANAQEPKIVMGCIGAAMYPKLLVRDGVIQNGRMKYNAPSGWRILTTSAFASIHPSSVNFGGNRPPDFGDARFVTYFTIMKSKKLYVWESGTIDEKAVFLLCGDADFKTTAQTVIIDRKIKASTDPKTLISLKLLRHHFQKLFTLKMKNPSHSFNKEQEKWLHIITEGIRDNKDALTTSNNKVNDTVANPPSNNKKANISFSTGQASKFSNQRSFKNAEPKTDNSQ